MPLLLVKDIGSICPLLVFEAGGMDLIDLYATFTNVEDRVEMLALHLKQILQHVCLLHCNGVGHMDLKPENVVLRDATNINKFDVALIDFQVAVEINKDDQDAKEVNSGKNHVYDSRLVGTEHYLCPDMHDKQPYSIVANDLYCIGMIAFALYANESPVPWAKNQTPLPAHTQQEMRKQFVDGTWSTHRVQHLQQCPRFDLFVEFVSLLCSNGRSNSDKKRLALQSAFLL
jgi:serine/threonine protein kinase